MVVFLLLIDYKFYMLEFQILDVDYVLVDEKPIIRIFGKTEGGETVCGFYNDYLPYFYVDGQRVLEQLKKEPQIVDIKEVERKLVMDHNSTKRMYKVILQNPAKTPEIRERLKTGGVRLYEADILFKYRFLSDMNLRGMGWVRINESNGAPTNTVLTDKKIQIKDISAIDRDNIPLKFLAFDIECVPIKPGTVPEAKTDPIIMISMVFSTPHKGKTSIVLSTRGGDSVVAFESEKDMLQEFIKIVNEYDPDVLTGYNVNNFDFPYILERMKKNNVRPVFGRCNQKYVNARKIGARYKVSIVGRIIVDSFEIIKKDFSLQRYGLDFVSKKLLNEKKDPVKHSEIEQLWKGDAEGFRKLAEYARKDSILAMNLVLKLNLIDKYVALSRVSGTLLQDTLESGETARIENFLLREFNKQGYVFPCKPTHMETSKREKERVKGLKGGYVLEPEKKLHSNVAVLDFKSMYPSIIISFNICPTTIVKNKSVDESKLIKTPSGACFVSGDIRVGIIPKILEELMEKRQAVKKRLKKARDPNKKRILDAEQWALKIMSNAFYGHMGYSRARIYDLDVANAITTCGRDIIKKTAEKIEKEFGYKIVYGDTDSVFVKIDVDDVEKIAEIGNKISQKVTKDLPGIIELEFEKVFKRFLPLTKKRYAAWKFEPTETGWEDGIEMKGIETVRRDWCELVSDTIKNVIDILLKKEDVKGSVQYFRGVIDNIVKGKTPIQKLVITKTMTKSPKNYAGIQPHIELAKKIQMRNPVEAPGVGDRIGYIIVKGTQLLSKRAEDPTYVLEKGLQIDSQYYVENQLLPPLERVFKSLNISKSELLGNGKQMGIFDAIKYANGNGHGVKYSEPEMPKEINIEKMNGFICTKCNKFYPRIPLMGNCDCGGNILFSSPEGPAEWVTT